MVQANGREHYCWLGVSLVPENSDRILAARLVDAFRKMTRPGTVTVIAVPAPGVRRRRQGRSRGVRGPHLLELVQYEGIPIVTPAEQQNKPFATVTSQIAPGWANFGRPTELNVGR